LEEELRQAQEATAQAKSSEQAAWLKNTQAVERIHSLAKERDQVRENLVGNQDALETLHEARYQVCGDNLLRCTLTSLALRMQCEIAVMMEQKAVKFVSFSLVFVAPLTTKHMFLLRLYRPASMI
jgi:hypothetical protein